MRTLFACLIAFLSVPAGASEIIQLTPEQSDRAIEAGAARNAAKADQMPEFRNSSRPEIHGEVGMTVGTGGMRGVYGTAAMPIGDNGFAAFSYENVRYGRRQGRP